MTQTKEIPIAALELLETDGFMKRYYLILLEAKTQHSAYSKTEDEYWNAFERRKYSDYRSFCECRRRWLKRHRPNLR